MKDTINKKIKEVSILLIAAVMVLSTVVVTASTNNELPELMLANTDYISQSQQTNIFDSDWIHFDDGTNVNAVGLTAGGTFEFAIRLTPDELAEWEGYYISTVRHHHGWSNDDPFQMPGTIKIYEEGSSGHPGALITSEPFYVYVNYWFDVTLSEPVLIAGNEDIWVSIEATHQPGRYPAGCDDGPMVPGKGGWIRLGGVWTEIKGLGIDVNWNIWAGVEESPEKPQRPYGPTGGVIGVEYTFSTSTTDPNEDRVCYLWDWDDETPAEWTDFYDSGAIVYANHFWNESGDYNITVKAKGVNNIESEWSDPKTIYIVGAPILEIDNTGGLFKVSTTIKNSGCVDATMVNWSITLDGGLILLGKETTGNILCIPAGDETTISSGLIIGFGNTVITVTAECPDGYIVAKKQNAFVLMFFVIL